MLVFPGGRLAIIVIHRDVHLNYGIAKCIFQTGPFPNEILFFKKSKFNIKSSNYVEKVPIII